jgi:hypothetical protein
VAVQCGELIAVGIYVKRDLLRSKRVLHALVTLRLADPRGIGTGFRALLYARPCAKEACERPIDDDFAEEFNTGIMLSIVVVDQGRGYHNMCPPPHKTTDATELLI